MADRFRLALIGVGRITISSHLPAALSLPTVEVVALVDPALDRTRRVAKDYGLNARITSDLGEILSDIDGAIIATPNHLHADAACTLLEAGIPVLIEKPLASSRSEAERIIEAAQHSGLTAGVGYCSRFQSNILFMSELLEANYFGRISRFAYQFGSRGGWAPFSAYNLERHKTGGGVVMVTGTHFLDRMLGWFGMPDELTHFDDGDHGPESNTITELGFHDDDGESFSGVIRFSKTCKLPAGLVMDTAKGRVVMKENTEDWPTLLAAGETNLQMELQPRTPDRFAPELDGFQRQIIDFIEACSRGGETMVPLRAGLDSLVLIERMYAQRKPLSTECYREIPSEESSS